MEGDRDGERKPIVVVVDVPTGVVGRGERIVEVEVVLGKAR